MRLDWPLALVVLVPIAGAVGLLLAWPIQRLLNRAVRGADVGMDDLLVAAAQRPLALLLAAGASRAALEWIRTDKAVQRVAVDVQGALAIIAVFWFLWRAIGVARDALPTSGWAAQRPAFRSLIPLVARLGRIFVLVTGVLAVLASFGYEVATLLAGLGIGGIAIAFAAQKTLEHFFGSVAIGIDQPFRVGDTTTAINDMKGLIGAWFDPATSGQGFELQWINGRTALLFFYGHKDNGENMFLVAQRDAPWDFGQEVEFELYETLGGRFNNLDPNAIQRPTWGSARITFVNCDTAVAELTGKDGSQVLNLERLGRTEGLDCG